MERLKCVWALLLSLMIISAVFNVQITNGQIEHAIIIREDGSIDPPDAPINRVSDNYYVLTSNLINSSIRVERSNIVIDGSGYTVQGTGRQYSIGIHLVSNTTNITIKNFVVKGFFDGIQMFESSGNTIINCTVTENGNSGIRFGARGDAPPEAQPSNNNVIGNIITNNGHDGIQLYKSTNNYIAQNLVAYNENYGIDLAQSSYNVFRNNTLIGNKYNFAVLYSPEFSHFINDVDKFNTVDGKPIYYLINQKDIVIDNLTHPSIGYLALVNSTGITVKWLTLQNSGQGILLAYTNNSQIINSTLTDNECGIKLCHSFSNTISGNLIKDGHYGSWFEYSTNNVIRNNNFANITTAIYLDYSPGNIIRDNIYVNVTTTIYDATPTTPPTNGQTQPSGLPPWMIATAIIFIAAATLTLLLTLRTKPKLRRKTSRTR
ncbi:MAG: NosD domain-containing protein [Candidatus Bathyarchaeia archaeon]